MSASSARRPPAHVFLDVSIECNLRCVQCDMWKLKNPPRHLSADERREVIRQASLWLPQTRVVLTGGELFLHREAMYETAAACRDYGVYATVSSNGTLIRDTDFERLPESGIRCIVFSIDSHRREVHDRIRGVPGSFDKVTKSVRVLVSQRRAGASLSVLTSTILGAHNLAEIPQTVDCLESLGVDTILFQPIQPVFARDADRLWPDNNDLFPSDMVVVDQGIDQLIALKQKGRRLHQTAQQFEDMRSYFRNPRRLVAGQCASMDHSLMVDILGQARLCFHMERIGLTPLANVHERTLQEIWNAGETERIRARMRGCVEGCGSMICHAR